MHETFIEASSMRTGAAIQKYNVLSCTRVGADDFDIYKMWYKHTSMFSSCSAAIIFRRPSENVDTILAFTSANKISVDVVTAAEFSNSLTMNAMRTLISKHPADIVLHCDTDEFLVGTTVDLAADLDDAVHGTGIIMNMVDRVSENGGLYDISRCETYIELCAVAPFVGHITSTVQKWSTTKLVLQPWPVIDGLHGTRTLIARRSPCYLDHFKWRTEWRAKAIRRLRETRNQNKDWAEGISAVLDYLSGIDAAAHSP